MTQRKSARKSSTKRHTSTKTPVRSAKTASRARTAAKPASKKSRSAARTGKSDSAIAAGDREVTIDRRRGAAKVPADLTAPATQAVVAAPPLERRKKVNRRRQIDPTTCERDYTDDEVEFMNAIDDYKRDSGRMFPTCSEVLEVLRNLGYQKVSGIPSTVVQEPQPTIALAAETTDWTLDTGADMTL